MKVMPKDDTMRKLLKHPNGNIEFREEGPTDWPDDSFTYRRLADGDIVLYEEPKSEPEPEMKSETKKK